MKKGIKLNLSFEYMQVVVAFILVILEHTPTTLKTIVMVPIYILYTLTTVYMIVSLVMIWWLKGTDLLGNLIKQPNPPKMPLMAWIGDSSVLFITCYILWYLGENFLLIANGSIYIMGVILVILHKTLHKTSRK